MSRRALQLKTEDGGIVGFMLLISSGVSKEGTCAIMIVPGVAGQSGVKITSALKSWSQGCTFQVTDDKDFTVKGKSGAMKFDYEGKGLFRANIEGNDFLALDGAMRND